MILGLVAMLISVFRHYNRMLESMYERLLF